MLPSLGDFFIYNASLLTLASVVCYFIAWRGNERYSKPGQVLFGAGTFFIFAACASLMYLILSHDYSVAYVANYSNNELPLYFLISTFWGGQEGTFLMWMLFMGIMGIVLMRTVGKKYEKGTMLYLGLIILSILVIVIKKSPFDVLPFTPVDGNGLNPLLQNYWMTIHPPTMFVGFAATAIPCVFALTALTQRSYDDWAERSRKWTLFAWLMLGIALIEGGYWAYETLGWGGFWAWDPVENASFIPWIFLTTQIHTTFIRQRRQGMNRFGLFMVCLTFLSVLYGTFLTRSGVLADFSVHSFVDLGINNFLIGGLFFFLLLTAGLFMMRWNDIKSRSAFTSVMSRSYFVTLGIVILFLGGVLTLLGTSAPLLTRFTDNPAAVSLSYYQLTMNPIAIAILLLLTLFPTFKWDSGLQKKSIMIAALSIAGAMYLSLALFADIASLAHMAMISLGVSAAFTNGYFLFKRSSRSHLAAPYLIHVGLATLIIGATTSAGLDKTINITMPEGQAVEAFGFNFKFAGIENPTGKEEHQIIEVTEIDGDEAYTANTIAKPGMGGEGVMRIPYVRNHLLYDLYIAPQAVQVQGGEDPGLVQLQEGSSDTLGPYVITFEGFELMGHDGATQSPTRVEALLTIEHDGTKEEIAPALRMVQNNLEPEGVKFDNDKGEVYIANIDASTGSVLVKFFGDFVPEPKSKAIHVMAAQVTVKPLINLFWLGAIIIFIGGGVTMRQGAAKRKQKAVAKAAPEKSTVSTGSMTS